MGEIGLGLIVLLLLLFSGDEEGGDGDGDGEGDGDVEPTETVFIPPEPKETVYIPPTPVPEQEEETKVPLVDIVDPYPRPASFYPVKKGDNGYGIAYRYLRSAGFLAAKEFGKLDDAAANQWAANFASKASRQVWAWKAIQCNGYNDALFATYGWRSGAVVPPTGRGIRLVPQHAELLERLASDEPAIRSMKWKSPASKGKGGGVAAQPGFREYETLWLPGLDLKKLWESNGSTLEFGGEWPGGASKIFPPRWVLKAGIKWVSGAAPSTSDFGCWGQEMEL